MNKTFENALKDFDIKDIRLLSNKKTKKTVNKQKNILFSQNDILALTKLISLGHPGFTDFPKKIQNKFLAGMKKLYADEKLRTTANIWNALEILPDNHLNCSVIQPNGKEKILYYHEIPKDKQIGKNLLKDENRIAKIKLSNSSNDRGGIGYIRINGKETAIIMMPDTGNLSDIKKITDFLDDFDNMMKKADSLDDIIIDIRGNPGGATCIHEYIARTLYGNEVTRCETETTRATSESAYVLLNQKEIPASDEQGYSKTEKFFSDGRGYLAKYPPFKNGGVQKPIYVLQNRETASAGEAFIYMMKNHSWAITIGSNTAGCVTYAGRKKIFLDNGFGVKIPFSKQTFSDQSGKNINVEINGFNPDIEINENAYDFVMNPNNANVLKVTLKKKNTAVKHRSLKEEKTGQNMAQPRIFAIKELTQHNNDNINTAKKMFKRLHPDLGINIFNSLVSYNKQCYTPSQN